MTCGANGERNRFARKPLGRPSSRSFATFFDISGLPSTPNSEIFPFGRVTDARLIPFFKIPRDYRRIVKGSRMRRLTRRGRRLAVVGAVLRVLLKFVLQLICDLLSDYTLNRIGQRR